MSGIVARPPTLMKICSASSSSPFTLTTRGDSKRACPWISCTLGAFLSQLVTPWFDCCTIASLRALTRGMSTRTAPSSITPKSAPRRATCAARALAINVLVGMQPLLTQVPPTRWRSIIATLRPALPRRTASGGPAWPVPMTIASKVCFMQCSSAVLLGLRKAGFHSTYLTATLEVIDAMTPDALWKASMSIPWI